MKKINFVRQTSYKDLVFARGEFLSVVGAQNESLRIIFPRFEARRDLDRLPGEAERFR